MSTRLFKKAALIFVATSCVFAGAIFLTIALFVIVQPLAGTAIAAAGTGGLYLGVAIICIVVMSRDSRDQAAQAEVASGPIPETKGNPTSQKRALANNIDESVAPILDILGDSGLDRERRALKAGASFAKQLHPFSLVVLAIVAGLILSRVLQQRWRLSG
ncbi:MAG: hypothetical protein ACREDV_13525 [Methylocella sp.]